MAKVETERKFLVKSDSWRNSAGPGCRFEQGYMPSKPGMTCRIRRTPEGGFITLKGLNFNGFSRREFEYAIPPDDAAELLELFCAPLVLAKTRYKVIYKNMTWEVDVFEGENAPLVLAEIELDSEESAFEVPPWAGKEVTGDKRFGNGFLASHPFSTWYKAGADKAAEKAGEEI